MGISTKKNRKQAGVYQGKARDAVVKHAIDLMEDWRLSPFEHEGSMRHGLRAGLCLKGQSWANADREAADIVADALRRMGGVRPSWEQGQPDYSVSPDYCRRCRGPLTERQKSQYRKFCSKECASWAITERSFETCAWDSPIGRAALQIVNEDRKPKRSCLHCGETFAPKNVSKDIRFCSQACGYDYRRMSKRECEHCGAPFQPVEAKRRYCSDPCARAAVAERRIWQACDCCGVTFLAVRTTRRFCDDTCRAVYKRLQAGQIPKRLTPPVFDYIMQMAA